MSDTPDRRLLDALLNSWDRSNAILLNLLHALPQGGLQARAMEGSPSVSEMFTHLHHERMVSVLEEAPEFAGAVPAQEWASEPDPQRIVAMLTESAQRVRDAVENRIMSHRSLELNYDHPLLLLQLLIFHDAYHHGQIKLALKSAGCPLTDDHAGPLTWDVWRSRGGASG